MAAGSPGDEKRTRVSAAQKRNHRVSRATQLNAQMAQSPLTGLSVDQLPSHNAHAQSRPLLQRKARRRKVQPVGRIDEEGRRLGGVERPAKIEG